MRSDNMESTMSDKFFIIEWCNKYGIHESTLMSEFEYESNGWIFNERDILRRALYECQGGRLIRIKDMSLSV